MQKKHSAYISVLISITLLFSCIATVNAEEIVEMIADEQLQEDVVSEKSEESDDQDIETEEIVDDEEDSENPEEPETPETPTKPKEPKYKLVSKIKPVVLKKNGNKINLRKLAGEKYSGYSIVQGACTDGKYAYYLMDTMKNEHGRILKVRIKDNKKIAVSKVIKTHHGNGMTFDTKRNRIVVVGRKKYENYLTIINAKTLKKVSDKKIYYPKKLKGATKAVLKAKKGFSAISYIPEKDCYIVQIRERHDFMVLNGKLKPQRYIITNKDYSGTYQAIDADTHYVYVVLSPKDKKQQSNIIAIFNWKGKFIKKLKSNVPYESENLYHIDTNKGTIFYMSIYKSGLKKKNGKKYITRDDYLYKLGLIHK